MIRTCWLTDIHLNFIKPEKWKEFIALVTREKPDQIWLGGDIGESDSFSDYMRRLSADLKAPIYFVLGNHDFYNGSLAGVKQQVRGLCQADKNLHWLPETPLVELPSGAALLGHGGWADGRLGDYGNSTVLLNDYLAIEEFRTLLGEAEVAGKDDLGRRMLTSSGERLRLLNRLGDESAQFFRERLPAAVAGRKRLFILTHVPPYAESCWYEGKNSDANYLPHFSNSAAGAAIREAAAANPNCHITVLCGHTHGEGKAQILPNLEVLTGGATYGVPYVQQVFEV